MDSLKENNLQRIQRIELGLYERIVGVKSKIHKCSRTHLIQHYDLQFMTAKEQGDLVSVIADYRANGKVLADEKGMIVDFKHDLPNKEEIGHYLLPEGDEAV